MDDPSRLDLVAQAAAWLGESRTAIALTGAGISTDSGIPDFRSPTGVWATQQPVYFPDFLKSAEARFELWRQKSLAFQEFRAAKPNRGHEVLARWQGSRRLARVVTQNIDGLHTEAGCQRVVEVHGSARDVVCLGCQQRWPAGPWAERFEQSQAVPACPDCGGLLKWGIVLFGEPLDPGVWREAEHLAQQADLVLAIGSSLVVEPAASLPRIAKRRGARLILINGEETPLDDEADLVIRGGISETLTVIDARLTS